ncbi:hypothetical protein ABPG74_021763 [Tetrahymena malaccensis]
MNNKQAQKSTDQKISPFEKIQLINQKFYIEKLYYLVQNYKRHLGLGYTIIFIKYLFLIVSSNNEYIVNQIQISEPYLLQICSVDMHAFLKNNSQFDLALEIVGLVLNFVLIMFLLVEYLVFLVVQYQQYNKNIIYKQIAGQSFNVKQLTDQQISFSQSDRKNSIVDYLRMVFSFIFQIYNEIFTIPLIFISSVSQYSSVGYTLLASTYFIGLIKEDCDYDYSLQSNDALARKQSKFSIFSYSIEFILIFLTQVISDDIKSIILLIVFALHLTKNVFLRLYYNFQIQKFFNICSIYSIFLSGTLFLALKIDNRPANILCFLLIIFMPISIKVSMFIEEFQIEWIHKNVPIIQEILFETDTRLQKNEYIQYGNESILDPIIRRIYCSSNNLSEDILVYSIICNKKMNEKQFLKEQKDIQINQKSAGQLSNFSPSKKKMSKNFDFNESIILGLESGQLSSRYLNPQENSQSNIQKGDYFINEQTINGTTFISKEQVYGEDTNLKVALQRIFQSLFNKLTKNQNTSDQEKCYFLYLVYILQVLKNYQLFLLKYYQYTQQNKTSLKSKQKYFTLFKIFQSYTVYSSQFISNNENDIQFSNGYLLGISFEESLKECYILLDKAINLKAEILYTMKQKYIELKGLIKKLRSLLSLRVVLRNKLNELAFLNQHNTSLQFIYSVYLECLSFTDRDIRINFNNFNSKNMIKQFNLIGQENSNSIINIQTKNLLTKKLFNKDVGISFISMVDEKNSVIRKVSANFCRIFERKEEELIGRNIEVLMPRIFHKTHQIYVQKSINIFNSINLHKPIMFGITQKGYIIPIEITLKYSQISTQSEFGMSALVKSKQSQGQEYLLFDYQTKQIAGATQQLQQIVFSNYKDCRMIELQKHFPFIKIFLNNQLLDINQRINQPTSVAFIQSINYQQQKIQNFNLENSNSFQLIPQNSEAQIESLLNNFPKEISYLLIIEKQQNEHKRQNSFEFYHMKIQINNLQAGLSNLMYLQMSNLHQLYFQEHSNQILQMLKGEESNLFTNKSSFHKDEIEQIIHDLSQVTQDQNYSNNSISEKSEEDEYSQPKSKRSKNSKNDLIEKVENNNSNFYLQSSPQLLQFTPSLSPLAISINDGNGNANNYNQAVKNNYQQAQLKNFSFDKQQAIFQSTVQEIHLSQKFLLSDPNIQNNVLSNDQLLSQDELNMINSPKLTQTVDLPYQNLNYEQTLSKSNQVQQQNKVKQLGKGEQEVSSSIYSNKIDDRSIQNRTTIISLQKDQTQSQIQKQSGSYKHLLNQQKFFSKSNQVKQFQLDNSEKKGNTSKVRKNIFDLAEEDEDQGLKDKLDQCSTHSRESSVVSTRNTLFRIINTKKSLSVMRIISLVGLICIGLIIAVTIQQYINCLQIFNDQIDDLKMFDWPISIASEMSLMQKNENLQNLIQSKAFNSTPTQSLQQLKNQSLNELNTSFNSFQDLLSQMESPNVKRQIFQFVRNQNFTFGFVSQVIQRNNNFCNNNGNGNQNNSTSQGGSSQNQTNSNNPGNQNKNNTSTNNNSGNSTNTGSSSNSTSTTNNNSGSGGSSTNSTNSTSGNSSGKGNQGNNSTSTNNSKGNSTNTNNNGSNTNSTSTTNNNSGSAGNSSNSTNSNSGNSTSNGNQSTNSTSTNNNKGNSTNSGQGGGNNQNSTNSNNNSTSGNNGGGGGNSNKTNNNNCNNQQQGNFSQNFSQQQNQQFYNGNKNSFIVKNLSTSLDYSLILLSQYLYRYALVGDNVGEQGFLQNQQLALNTLNQVYISSKQDTFDQLQNTQQQLDQLMIVIIVINAVCLLTVFPLYSFIQQKRQQILTLFGTFNSEKLDMKITLLSTIYNEKNAINSQIEINYQKYLKRQLLAYQKADDFRKQSVSETSKLSRINKGVILLTIIVYGLSIIYPLLNKFVTTQFISQSNQNTILVASIFEIKGFMLESLGENYLSMLLAVSPNRKQYNLTSQLGQLTTNVDKGNELLSNLQQTIQSQQQFQRYQQDIFNNFLFPILEGNICDTLQAYPQYVSSQNQIDLNICRSTYGGIMTQGLILSLVDFFKFFEDLLNLYNLNNSTLIQTQFKSMMISFDINDFNIFETYLTKVISILRDFILMNSQSYFDFINNFQLSILFYQLFVMVLVFLIGWISFYTYLDYQIYETKQFLSLFDINFLVENTYVYNYLKSNVNY